jgi:hypothetical protein
MYVLVHYSRTLITLSLKTKTREESHLDIDPVVDHTHSDRRVLAVLNFLS